jgi:acetyl esterase/lipase
MVQFEGSPDETLPNATAPLGRPLRRLNAADKAALTLSGAALLASPLQWLQAPTLSLFWAQLALSEHGHWLAAVLLALALPARLPLARRLALIAAVLSLLPMGRALGLAPQLRVETELAWGAGPSPRKPFSPSRLWLPSWGRGVQRDEEPYDPARSLGLSLWSLPEDRGLMTRRPVVLVLHSGGWDGGRRDEFSAFNAALARLGWVVAAMDYRLAPEHPWPAQREDVLKALEHLRQHAKRLAVDPGHVVLLGRSAGAHLALDFAYSTQDPAIQGVIGLYGPADLRFAWEHGRPDDVLDSLRLLRQFCGGEPSPGGCFDDASPIQHVSAGSPPTLLLHGRNDALVWHRQSERLRDRLREQGVPHQFVSLPWATHGFDWAPQSPGGQAALYSIEHFLMASERGKLTRKRR